MGPHAEGSVERRPLPRVLRAADAGLSVASVWIVRVCGAVIFTAMVVMLLTVTFRVINRNVMNWPLGGTEEISRYALTTLVFIGLPVVSARGAHIAIDFLAEKLEGRSIGPVLSVSVLVVDLAFLVWITVLASRFVVRLSQTTQVTPGLDIPLWWTRAPMPIGFGLSAVIVLGLLVRAACERFDAVGRSLSTEAA